MPPHGLRVLALWHAAFFSVLAARAIYMVYTAVSAVVMAASLSTVFVFPFLEVATDALGARRRDPKALRPDRESHITRWWMAGDLDTTRDDSPAVYGRYAFYLFLATLGTTLILRKKMRREFFEASLALHAILGGTVFFVAISLLIMITDL